MKTKPVSFAIGTVVKFADGRRGPNAPPLIITAASIDTGELEYAVNGSAWFYPSELVFVSEATKETLKEAIKTEMDEADAWSEEAGD